MTIFFLVVFGCYFCFVLLLLYGWELSIGKPTVQSTSVNSIAVIIPFRNESSNIKNLVESLSRIQYPNGKLEFIFINDHSLDNSVEIVTSASLPNITVLNLGEGQAGKKAAITKGIEFATSEIIVTTDADCTFNENWLNSINSFFGDPKTNMVVGAVTLLSPKSFFGKVQAIEFSSLVGAGASLLQWKIPAMANGANLAFRRNIFFDVKGYEGNEHIPSGDDEYLLRKVFTHSPYSIIFNSHPESVVDTNLLKSIRAFFGQRIRWAGKWKYQTNLLIKWIAALIFAWQCLFGLALLFYAIYGNQTLLILLLSKAVMEAIFLIRVGQFLRVRLSLLPFMLLQIIYPVYVVVTAIGSLFLSFEWKERKY